MIPINAILGCHDGEFKVSVFYNLVTKNRDQRRKRESSFPADKPDQVIAYLKETANELGDITNLMCSSSMDFPDEYGVTKEQAHALDLLLEQHPDVLLRTVRPDGQPGQAVL